MSSQPLALAIRLAAKQEEEQEAEAESGKRPAAASLEAQLAENAGLSSGKGGVEEGRGNLRFWLRDIKIAESLYTINRSAKHLVEFTDQMSGSLDQASTSRPIPIMSDGDVMFMTQLTGDITRCVGEISAARYHGMKARKRKHRHHESDRHQHQHHHHHHHHDEHGGEEPQESISSKRFQKSRDSAPERTDGRHSCHRCGRTDTPEWRTGPDGPRTLCNVCGLVYAKQRRKRDRSTAVLTSSPSNTRI